MTPEQRIDIQSGELRLEGSLSEGACDLAALVLHPHPKYGGDMDNHVVVALCDAFRELNATTLRVNFRGAGRSEGQFHGHGGEVDDARAALARLREAAPGKRIVLAGYSFGAAIAASIAAADGASGLVLISLPAGMMGVPPLSPGLKTLLITGEQDHIAPPAALEPLASAAACQLIVVPGADHGWWPGVDALHEHVLAFTRSLIAP